MPQFDVAHFIPQLVWLSLFFAILYFGIVRMTLPRVGRVVDAREAQVTGDIATAEGAKAQADALAADYASGIDAAHAGARARTNTAKAEASARIEKALATANAALAEKAAVAEAALAEARTRALGEIETVASDATADIVERLTGTRPDPATVAAAAKNAMAA